MKKCCSFLVLSFLSCWVCAQTWDTIPNLPDHYRQKVEEFKKEPIVKGRTLFLGNRLTEGGNWRKLLRDSSIVNRGIAGDITFGVLNRINDIIKRQPSRLFLLIGMDDIGKGIPDEVIMENVFSVIHRIRKASSTTKIFLQSILPINSSFKDFPSRYNRNDHVVALNHEFQKYASRMGYTYIDLYSSFLDKENRLDARFSTDGIQLNQAGYVHWVEILKGLNCL
jgi:lysophospholipase L1-like esterase